MPSKISKFAFHFPTAIIIPIFCKFGAHFLIWTSQFGKVCHQNPLVILCYHISTILSHFRYLEKDIPRNIFDLQVKALFAGIPLTGVKEKEVFEKDLEQHIPGLSLHNLFLKSLVKNANIAAMQACQAQGQAIQVPWSVTPI